MARMHAYAHPRMHTRTHIYTGIYVKTCVRSCVPAYVRTFSVSHHNVPIPQTFTSCSTSGSLPYQQNSDNIVHQPNMDHHPSLPQWSTAPVHLYGPPTPTYTSPFYNTVYYCKYSSSAHVHNQISESATMVKHPCSPHNHCRPVITQY